MEEKKEKKTIKCSYAVLVIILFSVMAFLTDYIVIDRKTRKCDCPKCEATNNEVISRDIEDKDNTDNEQVTENEVYSYEDIFGVYYSTVIFDPEISAYEMDIRLSLNDDYTFVYEHSYPSGHRYYGNYIIDGDSIILNYLYSQGTAVASIHGVKHKNIIKISSDGSLIDSDQDTAQYYQGETFNLVKDNENKYQNKSFDNMSSMLENGGIYERTPIREF